MFVRKRLSVLVSARTSKKGDLICLSPLSGAPASNGVVVNRVFKEGQLWRGFSNRRCLPFLPIPGHSLEKR